MPRQRAPNQKQVIVLMRESFLREIDAAINRMGFSDRANFIRHAVLEKMQREGISLSKELATAPDRAGKGGRPKAASYGAALLSEEHDRTEKNSEPTNKQPATYRKKKPKN